MVERKTHKSAVVIIPPEAIWPSIQAIRERYDRQIRRWMPHITLLYPFRPRDELQDIAKRFALELRGFNPFAVELRELRFFRHRQQSYTVWLSPEPQEPLQRLQSSLLRATPDCNDVVRIEGGFVPHLSVGQVKGEKILAELLASLRANWRPVSFTVEEVSREGLETFVGKIGKPGSGFDIWNFPADATQPSRQSVPR